jgi:hypothetical protein
MVKWEKASAIIEAACKITSFVGSRLRDSQLSLISALSYGCSVFHAVSLINGCILRFVFHHCCDLLSYRCVCTRVETPNLVIC